MIDFIRHREAELHFEAYYRMRIAFANKEDCFLNLWPEMAVPSDEHRSGFMRVDLAVGISPELLLCVIEVKRPGKTIGERSRQARAYMELAGRGFTVFYLNSFEGIDSLIRKIIELENHALKEPNVSAT